ncbi:hypothetical protein Pint_14749 [Pistacia integerrima]|uniref:Uncharacterized protein n=1 Tax=Pistacia integerrima TaxID=434235 RepID=A0ACC0Y916_9ROSI|nr:hypothetical protein Pint_14749 [Pistacia integerrima]
MCNETYVVNYCSIGNYWIGFDDVEAIIAKISYAKEKKLLGYHVWLVSSDQNWELSQVAVIVSNKSMQWLCSPEYIQKGIYSTKSDVYSFGILLLQIISGKRTSLYYGSENLSLPQYVSSLIIHMS